MLRLPDGMRDILKAAAEENGRSMNAEIVARLQESLDGNQSLWDSVNRIEETVTAMQRDLERIAPKVESLWSRPYDGQD